MDQAQREHFRRLLLKERERLLDTIEAINRHGLWEPETTATGEFSSYDQHPADQGTETYERSKDLGLRESARIQVQQVEEALARLDQGTYGVCGSCGQPIPEARLEALPYAERCLACQEAAEVADRQVRPVEEDVLESPWARSFSEDRPENRVGFDGEDAWQRVAKWGTANTPQDVPDAIEYDETYINADEDVGIVQAVEDLPDLRGIGVTDPGAIYPDPNANPRRRPVEQEWEGTLPE